MKLDDRIRNEIAERAEAQILDKSCLLCPKVYIKCAINEVLDELESQLSSTKGSET